MTSFIPPEQETFTQGQLDEYATKCLETERRRIHGILSRVLVKDSLENPNAERGGWYAWGQSTPDMCSALQNILDKAILNNKK